MTASTSRFTGVPLTILAGLAAVVSAAFLTWDFADLAIISVVAVDYTTSLQLLILYGPVYVLLYGAFSYTATRYGHFKRATAPTDIADVEKIFDVNAGARELLVLVPSYKEELNVIRQTLMSAALVEYPAKQVTLLIDNPPTSSNFNEQRLLIDTRRLIQELQTLFDGPATQLTSELDEFVKRKSGEKINVEFECGRLGRLYQDVSDWIEKQAMTLANEAFSTQACHVDQFFIEQILLRPAAMYRDRARDVAQRATSTDRIMREYHRLAAIFRTRFVAFERKKYANMSHAPNKAMNLNSYMALIGGRYREMRNFGVLELVACQAHEQPDVEVPLVDYVLNLDADSVVLHDYALRLIDIMNRPGNERLAVVQTPYSAFPNPPGLLERIAGATTDIQYLSHQGMTFFDATSWVGANALLRRAALEDISTTLLERGYQCKVYIQDTTLIEDTAATVDLIAKGWRLYNYPCRLAYSATPSDFGALLIQRRRWSNGGLLIFPSLLHYTFKWPLSLSRIRESLVRSHYVLSPALMSTAMLLLTFASFDDRLFTIWVPLAAVPYQILYACDLSITGRSWRDLARVYSLNMGLIVVHLGGTLQSLRQALTGRKPEFGRTPKVAGRTTTPVVYLGAIYILTLWCVFLLSADAVAGRTYHLLFTSINTMAFTYVLVVYIGVGAAVEDIRLRIKSQGLLLQAVRQRALPEPTLPVLALPAPDTAPLIEATRLTASHAGMMEGAASISPYHSGEEKSWSTARL